MGDILPLVMSRYDWKEIPDGQKNELPADFRNVAFRRLFEKLAAKPGSIIRHFEDGPTSRAVLVDLAKLMDTEGLTWNGPTLDELEYKLLTNSLPSNLTALIISTVEKEAIAALFEGNLPSYFAGAQNTPPCKKATEEAIEGLGTEIEELDASVSVDEVHPQAQFVFYFIWRIYAGGPVDGDGKVRVV